MQDGRIFHGFPLCRLHNQRSSGGDVLSLGQVWNQPTVTMGIALLYSRCVLCCGTGTYINPCFEEWFGMSSHVNLFMFIWTPLKAFPLTQCGSPFKPIRMYVRNWLCHSSCFRVILMWDVGKLIMLQFTALLLAMLKVRLGKIFNWLTDPFMIGKLFSYRTKASPIRNHH